MKPTFSQSRKPQAGMTLVETMMALAVLLIVAAGVMGLAVTAVSTTETQGHLAARTAEYAQDKMEQLLALKFCDSITDTTVFPASSTTGNGTGLAGCNNPGNINPPPTALAGGGLDTTAPVAGYADYLDLNGNLVAAGANWEYIRVWQISVPAGSTAMKQVSVKTQVRYSVGSNGLLPQSTVVALKTFPF